MKNQYSLLTMALLACAFFSSSAHATVGVWDTPTPWGASSPTYFAGWNNFDAVPSDNTPDVAGSDPATFTFGVAGAFLTPNNGTPFQGDVNTPPNNSTGAYQALLAAGTGGFYDVYFRMESIRELPTTMSAILVIDDMIQGVPPASLIGNQQITLNGIIGDEFEYYWVWHNIPGSSYFNVFVSQNSTAYTITSLAEIAAVQISTPVPEPETYALFLAGLGLMGAVARRRHKTNTQALSW